MQHFTTNGNKYEQSLHLRGVQGKKEEMNPFIDPYVNEGEFGEE
jgi:hypothetical protein